MQPHTHTARPFGFTLLVVAIVAALLFWAFAHHGSHPAGTPAPAGAQEKTRLPEEEVELTANQLRTITIAPAATHLFHMRIDAVGSVAYHEKEGRQSRSKSVVANVRESDSPQIRVGEKVSAKMMVYPDRTFEGKVSAVGVTIYDSGGNPAIDPNTHRIAARCDIQDPANELYPGMLATITIDAGNPIESIAVPQNAVVREGDGAMTLWVAVDDRHFAKRTVKTGIRQDGYLQVLDGLHAGERVVTENAVFLSNMNNDDAE